MQVFDVKNTSDLIRYFDTSIALWYISQDQLFRNEYPALTKMMNTQTDNVQRGLALPALRSIRERRALSQEELANQAGMTRATIVNLEHGASRARPSSASRLAAALQVPVDVLTGAAPLPTGDGAPAGVFSEYFAAALRHAVFRQVSERHIYAAIPGIEGLWARGLTREEAVQDLSEALEWFVLTNVFEHRPLPSFDGVSLEIVEENKAGSHIVYPVAPLSDASPLDVFDEDEAGEDAEE